MWQKLIQVGMKLHLSIVILLLGSLGGTIIWSAVDRSIRVSEMEDKLKDLTNCKASMAKAPAVLTGAELEEERLLSRGEFVQELYSYERKVWEYIRYSEVETAVVSGTHGFQKDSLVTVLSPDGSYGTVPASKAGEAFRNGFKWSSAEERCADIRKDIAHERGIGILDNKWLYILFGFFVSYMAAVKWVRWLTR